MAERMQRLIKLAEQGDYKGALKECKLDKFADRILQLQEKAIRLVPSPDPQESVKSRLGGNPDVPAGFTWPCSDAGAPLSFLAQIDLADVREHMRGQLPENGSLSFFYDNEGQPWGFDPADRSSWKVYYFADNVARSKATAPEGIVTFTSCAVRFETFTTFPNPNTMDPTYLEIPMESRGDYFDFWEACRGEVPVHQLLGHPWLVQGDLRDECQLASHGVYCGDGNAYIAPEYEQLRRDSHQWRLLLQIDSDEATGFEWGDCGSLYFTIPQPALVKGDFDKVWMVLQCY